MDTLSKTSKVHLALHLGIQCLLNEEVKSTEHQGGHRVICFVYFVFCIYFLNYHKEKEAEKKSRWTDKRSLLRNFSKIIFLWEMYC